MELYMAPMKRFTGYIYRNVYHACFRPVGRYFTSFVSPRVQGGMKSGPGSQEINDILPEHNGGLCVIPQIPTNGAGDLLRTAPTLEEYSYREVNSNLGCSSSTVVSKNKGAGLLSTPRVLNMFLEAVAEELDKTGMKMSVEARLGIYSSGKFYHLLEAYNEYLPTRLIIHSRARTDYYKNTPDREVFGYGLKHGSNPVYYSGDLFTAEDFRGLTRQYPKLRYVMMGRGIIANSGLVETVETGTPPDKVRLEELHQRIYKGYRRIMSRDRDVLLRMKEIWASVTRVFSDDGRYDEKIKEAQRFGEYEAAASQVSRDLDIVGGAEFKLY